MFDFACKGNMRWVRKHTVRARFPALLGLSTANTGVAVCIAVLLVEALLQVVLCHLVAHPVTADAEDPRSLRLITARALQGVNEQLLLLLFQ
jgi:hypothetical protein